MFLKFGLFCAIALVASSYIAHEYYPEAIIQLSSQFPVLKTVGTFLHDIDVFQWNTKLWSRLYNQAKDIVYNRENGGVVIKDKKSKEGKNKGGKDILMTKEQLAKYDGVDNKKIYLALMGLVFDVTKGSKHYGPGGSYAFFAGKDATRSFVSGDFSSEAQSDDIEGLSPNDYLGLQDWVKFYRKDYTYVGKVVGRYYTSSGKPTEYWHKCQQWFKQGKEHQLAEEEEKKKFPPCNVEWSQEKGSKVWCTTKSGGIDRTWAGVPRRLFLPGKSPKCVCVLNAIGDPRIKEYTGCPPNSASCKILKEDQEDR